MRAHTPCSSHDARAQHLARIYWAGADDRHVFMNALRSSPFLSAACVLHTFIFSCWVMGAAAGFADRHVFMNALRSSPFLSAACLLQSAILVCWLFAANTGDTRTAPSNSVATADW